MNSIGKYPSSQTSSWTHLEVTPRDDKLLPYLLERPYIQISGEYAFILKHGERIGYVPLLRCKFVEILEFGLDTGILELP